MSTWENLGFTASLEDGVGFVSGLAVARITIGPEGGLARIGGCDLDFDAADGTRVLSTHDGMTEIDCAPGQILVVRRHNAMVNLGLQITLDKLFGLNGPPTNIDHIGLSSDNTAVTATTTTVGGTVSIKTYSPAASRAAQTVTAGNTFTQADVAFVIRKVFLLNTATDAGTGTLDIIGGSGVAPFNQTFTIDLTTVTTWSLLMQVQLTASAT